MTIGAEERGTRYQNQISESNQLSYYHLCNWRLLASRQRRSEGLQGVATALVPAVQPPQSPVRLNADGRHCCLARLDTLARAPRSRLRWLPKHLGQCCRLRRDRLQQLVKFGSGEPIRFQAGVAAAHGVSCALWQLVQYRPHHFRRQRRQELPGRHALLHRAGSCCRRRRAHVRRGRCAPCFAPTPPHSIHAPFSLCRCTLSASASDTNWRPLQ